VLLASEEDNVNEYKSYLWIVLDYPQFQGKGETKEGALRHVGRLLLTRGIYCFCVKFHLTHQQGDGSSSEVGLEV
ncbi:hypothetical protein M758_2G195700, partial [Ceratodon purpureus]